MHLSCKEVLKATKFVLHMQACTSVEACTRMLAMAGHMYRSLRHVGQPDLEPDRDGRRCARPFESRLVHNMQDPAHLLQAI